MKTKNILLAVFALLLPAINAFADSPLTSTAFYKGYLDVAIIKTAAQSNGEITEEQLQFLTNTKNPIAVKLALINSLEWSLNRKSNAPQYLGYLFKQHPKLNKKNFINKATAEDLICYAYLKAMDNYLNVKTAIVFAKQAIYKAPTTYSINLIGTLIQTQPLLNTKNSCGIYTKINQVCTNKKLKMDIRNTSIKAILGYTDIYKEYCK